MKIDDKFLLNESLMEGTEKRYVSIPEPEQVCVGIPTEPEEMRVLEFNQFSQ